VYVHGSNKNVEYKTQDHSFYKGIVIDNFDDRKAMRIKVFIPELSNQLLHSEGSAGAEVRYPNSQIPGLNQKQVDTLKELLPYAEQCAPLMGESGLSRYYAPDGTQPGKGNQPKDTDKKRNAVPTSKKGGIMPRVLSTIMTLGGNPGGARIIDAWADGKYGKQNTTGSAFAPKNSGPEASGAYGVPQVGSHVWVFHHRGDYNFPVYFGVAPSYRETAMVFQNGGYPDSGFESNQGEKVTPTPTGSPSPAQFSPGQQLSPGNFRATAYGLASIDPTTAEDQRKADAGTPGYEGFSQTRGASGRTLIAGYSVASNYFPQGTLLRINGKEYRVDDTGSQKYLRDDGIDFFSGNNKQQYDAFARMNIESIQIIGQYNKGNNVYYE
jgi:hypothetical protein